MIVKEIKNKVSIIISFILIYVISASFSNEAERDSIKNVKEKSYIDILISQFNKQETLQNDTVLNLLIHINDLSKELNYKKGIAETNYLIGNFYDLRSIGDSSIKYYLQGWEVGKQINYNHYINRFGEYIAETFWETGHYFEGIDFTQNVIDHYIKINYTDRLFYLYDVLALMYRDLGDVESALDIFNKSYKHAVSIKQFGFAGTTLTNIGALYLHSNELDTALKYYEKGVIWEEEYGHIAYAGRSYVSIALIYLKLNDIDQTKYYLSKALKNNSKSNDPIGYSRTYKAYGELSLYKNNYKTALKYFKQSEQLAVKGGKNLTLADIYQNLSKTYDQLNIEDSSLIYLQKYLEIYESSINIQKLTDLKKIEYNLKVEKNNSRLQQLEIEKQKTKNTLLTIIFVLTIIVTALFGILYFQSIRSKKRLRKINKELEFASIRATESDQLKTKFLQNISHEIRTPLNGIVGFSSMLTEVDLTYKELKDISYYVNKSSEDLISTIDNIVDIAHLTSNQYEIYLNQFYIPELFDDLMKVLESKSIYQDNTDIEIKINDLPNIQITTDKNILIKILVQIISNALKYTKQGSITIDLENLADKLKFYVKDTGVGISKEKINIIFKPFQQGNPKLQTRGNGLGLAIVNQMIDLLNGEIGVESEIKKGSTFWFTIPFK
jgi:signal transduction histidine kinase